VGTAKAADETAGGDGANNPCVCIGCFADLQHRPAGKSRHDIALSGVRRGATQRKKDKQKST